MGTEKKVGASPNIIIYKLERTPSLRSIDAKVSKRFLTDSSRRPISKKIYRSIRLEKLINLKKTAVTKRPISTFLALIALSNPSSKD